MKCGMCEDFGLVSCAETFREPTKNDDVCEYFSQEYNEFSENQARVNEYKEQNNE